MNVRLERAQKLMMEIQAMADSIECGAYELIPDDDQRVKLNNIQIMLSILTEKLMELGGVIEELGVDSEIVDVFRAAKKNLEK